MNRCSCHLIVGSGLALGTVLERRVDVGRVSEILVIVGCDCGRRVLEVVPVLGLRSWSLCFIGGKVVQRSPFVGRFVNRVVLPVLRGLLLV